MDFEPSLRECVSDDVTNMESVRQVPIDDDKSYQTCHDEKSSSELPSERASMKLQYGSSLLPTIIDKVVFWHK
jgi:hypothetical protein